MWMIAAASTVLAALAPLSGLHIDHVPIAVRDLPGAVAEFRALGFTIKPGRPHHNGIENASIKFADGSYVELITAHNGTDRLARQYEEMLKAREGASYLFLRDANGEFTKRVVSAGGQREESGPFAFTELPQSWHAPHLQLIQYLAPGEDSPDIYKHLNGALRVAAVWMFVDDRNESLIQELGALPEVTNPLGFDNRAARTVELANRTRLLLAKRRAGDPTGVTVPAILIEVDSLDSLRKSVSHERTLSRNGVVWLPATQMHGLWIGFVGSSKS
jgi:glyoxalase-like protein